MPTTAEQAIDALAQYFRDNLLSKFPTQGRRLIDWAKVTTQPALFIRHETDSNSWQGVGLSAQTVNLKVWIYARTADTDIPDQILNNLVQAIDDSFAPDSRTGWFTLGGLVFWCRIEGEAEYYPGDIANQAIAIVPVSILLP